MKIEKIIYDTTRGIYSVEDKLSIATIFIFCWKLSSKYFAELLYTDNHIIFIEKLSQEFSEAEIDLSIRLHDKNVKDAFYKTLEEVKIKYDSNGFFKALYNQDEYALSIEKIIQNLSTLKI